uniref:Uncharacterized protein n=1 Tax=Globodera rostochiensis TaxID=31243 RepID=A0A914H8D5_GLORO
MARPPPDTDFMDPAPENIQQGGWSARHYKQSPAIVYVEAFAVVADIVKHGNCWQALKRRHENAPFTVGLMDVWDFGALALFHALGIKNVVLIHNFPIMSHMYDYMDEAKWPNAEGQTLNYKKQILKNEVFAATVNNDSKIGKSDAFKAEHSASSLIFTTIYEQMTRSPKRCSKMTIFLR